MSDRAPESSSPGESAKSGDFRRFVLPNPCVDSINLHADERTVQVDGLADILGSDDWDGVPLEFDFRLDSDRTPVALGFYEREEFGSWSRVEEPIVILPHKVQGRIALRVTCRGFGPSVGRHVRVSVGGSSGEFELSIRPTTITVLLDVRKPSAEVRFSGLVATPDSTGSESRTLGIGLTTIEIRRLEAGRGNWDGGSSLLSLVGEGTARLWSTGFYYLEPWGSWSRDESVTVILPFCIEGRVRMTLDLLGTGPSVGQTLVANAGGCERSFTLEGGESTVQLDLDIERPVATLTISGMVARPTPGLEDQRTIGLGLRSIRIEDAARRRSGWATLVPRRKRTTERHSHENRDSVHVDLSGTVHLLELRADDLASGDWIQVVMAFVWAFRNTADGALIVTVPAGLIDPFCSRLLFQLSRVRAPRSRVIMCPTVSGAEMRSHLEQKVDVLVNIGVDAGSLVHVRRMAERGVRVISLVDPEFGDELPDGVESVAPIMRPARVAGSSTMVERRTVPGVDWDAFVGAFTSTARSGAPGRGPAGGDDNSGMRRGTGL